jgi:hypothetical protein
MESFQSLKNNAEQKLKVADHLLGTTYPLVKEPKLLISVVENMFQAMELIMTAVLEYEKNFKLIGNYGNTFEIKFEIFRRKIVTKYNIKQEILEFITDLKSTLDEHKKSSVEFKKKEKYIISDVDYNLRTLTADDLKKKLHKLRIYIDELTKLTK